MRTILHWTLLASLLGCPGNDKGGADSGTDTAAHQNNGVGDDTVQATMMVINLMDGSGMPGVTIESPAGLTEITDGEGTASLPIDANGTFQFFLRNDGAIDYLVFGPTGSEDFIYLSLLITESMLTMVDDLLGTAQEDGTGTLVVIIDYDDHQPVVGASAAIGADHGDSWIMTAGTPTFGDTVLEGGKGIVVFPNTTPGETSVTVGPPDGVTCSAFPGGGQMPNPPVLMNHVTIVTFHCRS